MKNYSVLFLLSILCSFLPFTSIIGQVGGKDNTDTANTSVSVPPPGIIKVGGEGTDNLELDENCEVELPLFIYAANLIPNEATENTKYNLPANYSELWAEVNINGQVSHYLVNDFNFNDTINSIPVYKKQIDVYFVDSTTCDELSLPPFEVTVNFSVRLVTPNNSGGYTTYPICNYINSSQDAFTCQAFDYFNPPVCPISFGTCLSSINSLTSSSDMIRVDCGKCHNSPRSESLEKEMDNSVFQVWPNPFSDQLQFNWTGTTPKGISLIDINGKVIQTWAPSTQGSNATLKVKMQKLSKGLYFVKVTTTDRYQTFKVIKS